MNADHNENLTEEEKQNIKKSKKMFLLAIVVGVLGFVVLIAACSAKESPEWVQWGGIIFMLLCSICAIWLIYKSAPDLIGYEAVKEWKKNEKRALFQMSGMSRGEIEKRFESRKFTKIEGEYYWKKKFYFSKDFIHYYVRCVTCTDVEETIEREIEYFNSRERKGRNLCLILFLYLKDADEDVWETIKQTGISYLVDESVMPAETSATIVPVGVDTSTGTARFLDEGKGIHISLYAHGCKIIKELSESR